MKKYALAWTAVLLTTIHVGCAGTAPITRGQSPVDPHLQTASHQQPVQPVSYGSVSPGELLYNHFEGSTISYFPPPGGGYGPAECPPYGCPPGHPCPLGYHNHYVCGPLGPACGPNHHMTYSYRCPNNLRYPDQSTTGGAVVYPYYTLKGPSCFFRDDERREF